MNQRPSSGAPVVAQDILAYLLRHPEASDTLEGIGRWWLLEQHIERTVAEIRIALAELTEKGFVNAHRQRDGRMGYRLNRAKEAEIRNQFESRPDSGAVNANPAAPADLKPMPDLNRNGLVPPN